MKLRFFVSTVLVWIVLMCSAACGSVQLDAANFPDAAFRNYVTSFDINADNVLSDSEIAAVTYIAAGGYASFDYERDNSGIFVPVYHSRYNIKNLKGIEHFTNLQVLDCSFNELEDIDVSSFPALTYLNCAANKLTSLDVSTNTQLKELWCCRNNISSLDLSKNTALEELYCWSNSLTELDTTHNTNLAVLFCADNGLTALDITRNAKLWSLSCGRNSIKTLDISKNPALVELYCFRNKLTAMNTDSNPALSRLSLTKNDLGVVNVTSNEGLTALDCGENYIAALDVTSNKTLRELYFYDSTIRNIDLSENTALVNLDCSRTNLMTLDVSSNTRLENIDCKGNSKLEALKLTSSDGQYQTDMREYVGERIGYVNSVQGYRYDIPEGEQYSRLYAVDTTFTDGIARFATMPHFIYYNYNIGYSGSANISSYMGVEVYLPRDSFIYVPEPDGSTEPGDFDHPSKVVSIDEVADFYPFAMAEAPASTYIPEPEPKDENETNETTSSGGGGGGGGCNSYGFGVIVLAAAGLLFRRKAGLLVLTVVVSVSMCYPAQADYVLPIEYTVYEIAGTWTADFELSSELREKISTEWDNYAVSSNKLQASAFTGGIHIYSEAALQGSWTVRPQDLYNLSTTGEYGGVVLPVAADMISGDIYVVQCTFSNDVQPGEMISVHGFQIDSAGESVSESGKMYLAKFVVFDENYKRVDSVPESRKVYVALSLTPEYINAGIVTVVRGEYVTEDDPLYRLTPNAAQNIADALGIASSDLKYLTRANIGLPVEPTEAMKSYVKSDDHEIVANLPTVSVDAAGVYVIPITLSGDIWETLKSKDIADYKFYALNDSDLGSGQMRTAIINGLLSTWEIFSMSGEKLDSFGVKEFLMVGLLEAGKPFSLYVARIILMLLLGGCNTGINPSLITAAITLLLAREIWRKR